VVAQRAEDEKPGDLEQWERLFREWRTSRSSDEHGNRHQRLARQARALLHDSKRADIAWPLAVLEAGSAAATGSPPATDGAVSEERQRLNFLLFIWHGGGQVPKRLFEPLMRAAVYERDASYNRWYIEPCLRSFGPCRVVQRLTGYLQTGTNREKAGANNALYWALGLSDDYKGMGATVTDWQRLQLRTQRLQEFAQNEDVEVRRSLIASLTGGSLDPAAYPGGLQALVREVIRIARSHPDAYIRHRVGLKTTSSGDGEPSAVDR
jgi:hypothetical protein